MPTNSPALMLAITIDSTNKWIDITVGLSTHAVSIAEATYNDIYDVVAALNTAMQAAFSNQIGARMSTTTPGKVELYNTQAIVAFDILWHTGTHGVHGSHDHIGDVLGFDDSANDTATGAHTFTSDNQAQHIWIAPNAPTSDTYDRPKLIGPGTFRANSGASYRLTWATHYIRKIRFDFIPVAKFLDAYSAINESFEEFWIHAIAGTPFTLCLDQTDLATQEGTYVLEAGENEDMLDGYLRLGPGLEYYPATLKLQKQP